MRNSLKWSELKPILQTLDKPALLKIIKALFDASLENRAFLTARFPVGGVNAALEPYRRRIVEQFFPRHGIGGLDLREARRAISEYRRATGDAAGSLELMLTYVENGTRFTCEYGDIDERFYSSLDSMLAAWAALVLRHPDLYHRFQSRLHRVALMAQDVGWGYADSVAEIVSKLDGHCAGREG